MELHELIETVNDQQSFYVFAEELMEDWHENPDEWESYDIGMFLSATTRWSKSKASGLDTKPTWRAFAEFLYAGKYYE